MVSTAAALKYLLVTIIIIVIHLHFGKEGYMAMGSEFYFLS